MMDLDRFNRTRGFSFGKTGWKPILLCIAFSACSSYGEPALEFKEVGGQLTFDTGEFKGELRGNGVSRGITTLIDSQTGLNLAKPHGLLSLYRLLDATNRYGTAAWDWKSEATLRDDGSVSVSWRTDEKHPFNLSAQYRWLNPHALDVTIQVTAVQERPTFEVFLASYFESMPDAWVAVNRKQPTFKKLEKVDAVWHLFPREPALKMVVEDGRWQRPPHPVTWAVRERYAMSLALRRDPTSGLTAVIMAPPGDCFAVAAPFSGEGHRSLYLSLFGQTLKPGETASARARLVIARNLSDQQALNLYLTYLKEL